MSDTDPPLVVHLPLSAWQIVLAHLQAGIYQAVAPSVSSILTQLEAQMAAAAAAQQAKVIEEAKNVVAEAAAQRSPEPGDANASLHTIKAVH
jgi:hypothetical protein